MILKCLIYREIEKDSVVDGGSGGLTAVSSQFHIVHSYDSYHTKREPRNSKTDHIRTPLCFLLKALHLFDLTITFNQYESRYY